MSFCKYLGRAFWVGGFLGSFLFIDLGVSASINPPVNPSIKTQRSETCTQIPDSANIQVFRINNLDRKEKVYLVGKIPNLKHVRCEVKTTDSGDVIQVHLSEEDGGIVQYFPTFQEPGTRRLPIATLSLTEVLIRQSSEGAYEMAFAARVQERAIDISNVSMADQFKNFPKDLQAVWKADLGLVTRLLLSQNPDPQMRAKEDTILLLTKKGSVSQSSQDVFVSRWTADTQPGQRVD